MIDDLLGLTSGNLAMDARVQLLELVWEAQRMSALANVENASNQAVRQVACASLSLSASLAAAILATGGLHAPVAQARKVIFRRDPEMPYSGVVPGFGNSLFRGRIDPSWQQLAGYLQQEYPQTWARIAGWSRVLRNAGKASQPNAAALTAAVAVLVGWPDGLEGVLVIAPRLTVWATLFHTDTAGKGLMS